MNVTELTSAGYREFNDSFHKCDRAFQRRIMQDGKTLYFINCYYYDNRKYRPDAGEGFQFEADFYRGTRKKYLNWHVEISAYGERSLKSIERFFAENYRAMKCVPDILNND